MDTHVLPDGTVHNTGCNGSDCHCYDGADDMLDTNDEPKCVSCLDKGCAACDESITHRVYSS